MAKQARSDDDRVREEAHKLWEAEGRPDGRADRHWAEAREIVALKDSMGSTLRPLRETLDDPVEPALAAENLGDLPGMTDRGDEVLAPSLDAARAVADADPLLTDAQAGGPARNRKGAPKAKNAPEAKTESKAESGKSGKKDKAAAAKPAAKSEGKAAPKKAKGAEEKKKRKGA